MNRRTPQSRRCLAWPLCFWIVGALVLFVRLLHGCWHIAGLRRRLQPIDDGRLAVLADVRRILNTKELPPLAMLPRATALAGPITVGLFRPLVIVPEDVLATLDSRGLRDVLVHEFAHAVRHDPLVGFVQRLAADRLLALSAAAFSQSAARLGAGGSVRQLRLA